MSQTRTGPKDVFGAGLAHQVGLALGAYDVTRSELNQIVANPLVTQRVAAAIKGQAVPAVTLDVLVAREQQFTRDFCALAQVEYSGDEMIRSVLAKAQGAWGTLTEHDRYVPAGIGLPQASQFFYSFNKEQEKAGAQTLKLYHEPKSEWWRNNRDVEHLPTQAGVVRCDFNQVMRPTDLSSRPFNLNYEDQVAWAIGQGGDGLTSAEEVFYLFARSILGTGTPLWGAGSIRCRNRYGSAYSLYVGWRADHGLRIGYWDREGYGWSIGALPRKSVALGG